LRKRLGCERKSQMLLPVLLAAKPAVAIAIVETMHTAVVAFHFLLKLDVVFIVDPKVDFNIAVVSGST